MTPIQQLMLGAGGKKDAVYIDDVFSTNLWTGTNSSLAINNTIDLAGEGGLVWLKMRNSSYTHGLYDTVRGTTKELKSNANTQENTEAEGITAFNSNGFTTGTRHNQAPSGTGKECSSWTFRKSPMFDIVTYTGDGASAKNISHSLASIPGMIFIKRTDALSPHGDWFVWHRDLDSNNSKAVFLNTAAAAASHSNYWNGTAPTASQFTVSHYPNQNNATYVAYLFAGGESTAATARSVDFDGTGDYLETNSSTDFDMGTGDFTVEGWFKVNSGSNFGLWMNSDGLNGTGVGSYGVNARIASNGKIYFSANQSSTATDTIPSFGQWFHLALVRNSGTAYLYYNGSLIKSAADTTDYTQTNNKFIIGGYDSSPYVLNGSVSNFRVVKGTAVYTSSFRPPTEPLANITNTKLLCCNSSSVTGATVGTITANGDPTASSDSPFDDPSGFVFGESGSENVIKCGSYTGNGSSSSPPEINLGFEPQFLLFKDASSSSDWQMYDSMRQMTGDDANGNLLLKPNEMSAEAAYAKFPLTTSTGFNVGSEQWAPINGNGNTVIYMAIRRLDGYVSRPVEDATKVFAMDTGNSSSTIPNYDSGFPVGYAIWKAPGITESWGSAARLTGKKYLLTDTSASEADHSGVFWDSNTGWSKDGASNSYQSWMWSRRGQGFDVVAYKGSGLSAGDQQDVPHSMNKTPEMMIVKIRDAANQNWMVYHKGLNGGTNPEQYKIELNSSGAESSFSCWDNTAPNANSFRVGNQVETNHGSYNFIAMLFASVDGISSVGSYSGSDSDKFVDLGFQPRLFICKARDSSGVSVKWNIFDSTRGISGASTKRMFLNTNDSQQTGSYVTSVSSTGITLAGGFSHSNSSGKNYIYYAHA